MELLNLDKRDGYIYDPAIKGLDANFFAQLAGTTTVASSKLRYNAATNASFLEHEFGRIVYSLTIPVKPTAGDSRRWGLYAPGASADMGAIYFDITGAVFTVVVIDSQGNSRSSTITWLDPTWTNTPIKFEIDWAPDRIQFWVNGGIVATFAQISTAGIPFIALPLYVKNGNADNMDLSYICVKRAAGIV